MSFHEKSAIATTGALTIVYGAYFAIMARWLAVAPPDEIVYQPLMIIAVIPLTVLAALSHIAIALVNPKEANKYDERDRHIALRGDQVGGYVLAVGVFAGIVLAMLEFPLFFVAHALLLGWVIAEISGDVTKIVLYRRGA